MSLFEAIFQAIDTVRASLGRCETLEAATAAYGWDAAGSAPPPGIQWVVHVSAVLKYSNELIACARMSLAERLESKKQSLEMLMCATTQRRPPP